MTADERWPVNGAHRHPDGSARIRIGFYAHASRIGGAETYVRDVVRGLDTEIFEVHVFVPPWREFIDFLDVRERRDLKLHVVRIVEPATTFPTGRSSRPAEGAQPTFGTESTPSRIRELALALRLPPATLRLGHDALRYASLPVNRPRLAAAFNPYNLDILHSINGGYPGAASALAAVLAGRTTARSRVMTVCSTAMPRSILEPVERRVDHRLAGCLDAIVVPAERPADALISRGFRRESMEIIPWGARSIPYGIDPGARQRLGLSGTDPVIVCLANFTPTKGQGVIVDAMPALVARFPGIRAVLAGDGPALRALRERAAARGVAGHVHFPGSFSEPWDLLRAADVFVLASEIEGLPLVVLEAMSQGVPVVATDVGGMPEAVIDNVTGFLLPPGDPTALAAAVTRVLIDPDVALRMRKAALARFEQRFTMQRMLEAHRDLYLRLAGAAPHGRRRP
ncbi:MAG: glycosyltransferase family 4 protein [Candidatus Dormibacteria bacterium]